MSANNLDLASSDSASYLPRLPIGRNTPPPEKMDQSRPSIDFAPPLRDSSSVASRCRVETSDSLFSNANSRCRRETSCWARRIRRPSTSARRAWSREGTYIWYNGGKWPIRVLPSSKASRKREGVVMLKIEACLLYFEL